MLFFNVFSRSREVASDASAVSFNTFTNTSVLLIFTLATVVLLTFFARPALSADDPEIAAIVGGAEATPGQFPFMAQVNYMRNPNPGHSCGGVLISTTWVLSASHCFQESETRELQVVLGAHSELKVDPSEGTRQTIQVIRKVLHPAGKYQGWGGKSPDLILLELKHPVTVNSRVRPITINTAAEYGYSGMTTAVGWGATCRGCYQSPVLKFVTIGIEGKSSGGIIAGETGSKQTICYGDSGGPWVKGDRLIGITSASFSSDCSGRAGMADVALHSGWINSVITGNGGDAIPPSISVRSVSVAENAGTVLVPVELSARFNREIQFSLATVAGSAVQGQDFLGTASSIKIAPGTTRVTVPVTIVDDKVSEGDENFVARIFDITNADFFADRASVTIIDDENGDNVLPWLSVNSTRVSERDGSATVSVSLSNASTSEVRVLLKSVAGSANAGSDYNEISQVLSFAPGQTSQSVQIGIINDAVSEAIESFSVELQNPVNARLRNATGTVTITDDDPGLIQVSADIGDVSVAENAGTAAVVVRLNRASDGPVSVQFATAPDQGRPGVDYYGAYQVLNFQPGQTSQTVEIEILDDTQTELTETIKTRIFSNSQNVRIGRGDGSIFVVDDD